MGHQHLVHIGTWLVGAVVAVGIAVVILMLLAFLDEETRLLWPGKVLRGIGWVFQQIASAVAYVKTFKVRFYSYILGGDSLCECHSCRGTHGAAVWAHLRAKCHVIRVKAFK